jgi:4-amino-4-deoxy-L-arabinose transferase-like glycosyltransferase
VTLKHFYKKFPATKSLLLVIICFIIGLFLRLHGLTADGLWFDEIFGASYCNLSLFHTIVALLRFDIHPPTYYLQLHLWHSLFGSSDFALLLNSVFWSCIGLVSVYYIVLKMFDKTTAIVALVLTAISASEVYYAHELRMYTMMAALCLLGMYMSEKVVLENKRRYLIGLIVTLQIMSTLHGASLIPVSSVILYFCLCSLPLSKKTVYNILIVGFCTSIILLPCIANSSFRTISHGSSFGFLPLSKTVSSWVLGGIEKSHVLYFVFFSFVLLGTMYSLYVNKKALKIAVSFVLFPLFVGAMMSIILRPMWLDRGFSFCAPFAMILLAVSSVKLWSIKFSNKTLSVFYRVGILFLSAFLLSAMIYFAFLQGSGGYKMQYREAAQYLKKNAIKGDVIYVPDNFTYWAIARYYIGPTWGSILKIQDPVKPDFSDRWNDIYKKIGLKWIQKIGLIPEKRELESNGVKLVIGWSESESVVKANHIWLICNNRQKLDELALCKTFTDKTMQFVGFKLIELKCK